MEDAASAPPIALRNVLAATDFSAPSRTALSYALSITRRYGATLYLAHVVRPDPLSPADSETNRSAVEEAWRDGQRLTTDLIVSGELRGVEHHLLVGEGEIWEGLAPMVAAQSIDMIVVGTRGRTGLAKVLLGSVAERIFRNATCPVLTVGPNSPGPSDSEQGLRRILYATDFTAQSLHAAGYAISLARQFRAHLVLMHVISGAAADSSAMGQLLDNAKEQLRSLVTGQVLDFEPEFVVGFGTPPARILEVAAEKSPEVIVLGVTQSGRGAFSSHRWTNASEITGKAACPVLTVRKPETSG